MNEAPVQERTFFTDCLWYITPISEEFAEFQGLFDGKCELQFGATAKESGSITRVKCNLNCLCTPDCLAL
eukprot:673055-Pleurochrysis_carterae.AAC.1